MKNFSKTFKICLRKTLSLTKKNKSQTLLATLGFIQCTVHCDSKQLFEMFVQLVNYFLLQRVTNVNTWLSDWFFTLKSSGFNCFLMTKKHVAQRNVVIKQFSSF